MATLHVSLTGSRQGSGTESDPFPTIQHAAEVARPGDHVVVHEGVYREWVKPRHGGLSETRRITYRAADGEHVTIKGSEPVTDWSAEGDGVWRAEIDNTLFGEFNPYAEQLVGDWVVRAREDDPRTHLGDVYLNGRSFYEVLSRDAVAAPQRRDEAVDHWTGRTVPVPDPDQTERVWYAEVNDTTTTIWANFGEADPTQELVEINVRRSVFYPEVTGLNYITVRGFELAQAATPWAPPTADQPGLIGPNWAKGWIIEDNHIHDAKCSAVSIGKEVTTGHNFFTERHDKPGYQYQLESVFSAHQIGWSKERIGSHVIRGNTIHDCGQNGVVGHLGCVFSEIYDNHIFNIATKREFFGHEIAGIKLHAAIDTHIHGNHIHDNTLGVWLDWQTQGTRVSRNVMHGNCRDLFVEVSHGPYLVDNNVLASPVSVESMCQGGAYVGNLIAGTLRLQSVMDRATPYHVPHSTDVAGYAVIYAADDRWWGNVFVGNGKDPADISAAYTHTFSEITRVHYGTAGYEGCPATFADYLEQVEANLPGDLGAFLDVRQPAYLNHNVYLRGAAALDSETTALVVDHDPQLIVENDEGVVTVAIDLPEGFEAHRVPVATTESLPPVRFVDAEFENPDGSPLRCDTDLLGEVSDADRVAGPIESLTAGANRVVVWNR